MVSEWPEVQAKGSPQSTVLPPGPTTSPALLTLLSKGVPKAAVPWTMSPSSGKAWKRQISETQGPSRLPDKPLKQRPVPKDFTGLIT